MRFLLSIFVLILTAHGAQAEAIRGSLFVATPHVARATSAGLFIGRAEGGLFADRPAHDPVFTDALTTKLHGSDVQMIRALIQEAESPRGGYNAVQYGARIKPVKAPTDMTLAEIFAWIDATPGQPHAIGRYQFIPQTLRRLIIKTGTDMAQPFSPLVQDQLADVLLLEAGFNQFRAGALGRKDFMNNLAKIWAGLPNSTGVSHYDNYAGNKAVVSWAYFESVIAGISPDLG